MFYISAFFENNRDEYYERLLAVSRDSDWTGWVIFFLKAVQAQANDSQQKAIAILKLYDEMKIQIPELTHSQYAIHALDRLFGHPIFKSSDFIRSAGIPKATAIRILSLLKENNVLETIEGGKGRRSAILAYVKLLNIAEGYKAF